MTAQTANPGIGMRDIAQRLYTIRNIANLAAEHPESKAEAYVLQDVIRHVSDMAQSLIEDVEQEF